MRAMTEQAQTPAAAKKELGRNVFASYVPEHETEPAEREYYMAVFEELVELATKIGQREHEQKEVEYQERARKLVLRVNRRYQKC
jgi:hypothetical protein